MTKILGKSIATAEQMSQYLLSVNKSPKFSRDISAKEFCQLFLDVCAKEGVRGDIAFAQSCKETGHFSYGGDVNYMQNNFAGIGATGGVPGCIFSSIEEGILAQAQHLKTYATKAALNEPCVDPRRTAWFVNTKGGTSENWETLGGTWAVPGYNTKKYSSLEAANKAKDSYGYQIVQIYEKIVAIKVTEKKYHRVQVGSFSLRKNAEALQLKLKNDGYNAIIKKYGLLNRVQVGAFSKKENANALMTELKAKGYSAFVTYC